MSHLLCESCQEQTKLIKSVIQELSTQFSAFNARKAQGIQFPTSPSQPPPPPPPWPTKHYNPPISPGPGPECPLCDVSSIPFSVPTGHQLEISPLRWYLGQLSGTTPTPLDCEDMCIGISAYHRALEPNLGLHSPLIISDMISPVRYGRARKLGKFVDWEVVKTWLNICGELHDRNCHDEKGPQEIGGLKLIDCYSRTVVRASKGMAWIALSYVWSLAKPRPFSTTIVGPSIDQDNVLTTLPNILAGTIIDGIEATLALGYRYLWADQLCIDQSNPEEVADQVQKMDKIYRGAVLTIVPISNRGGLPGCPAVPRAATNSVSVDNLDFYSAAMDPVQEINTSTWATRGWCYQEEMLSRRLLYFTEGGVLLTCYKMTCYETICGPEVLLHDSDPELLRKKAEVHQMRTATSSSGAKLSTSGSDGYTPGGMNYKSLLDRCLSRPQVSDMISGGVTDTRRFQVVVARRVIAEFTKKKLSFDADSLTAVSGVLNVFGQLDDSPVQFCQGLPVMNSTQGFRDRSRDFDASFLESLCWFHQDPESARRRQHLPSWTWAGWSGAIAWCRLPLEGFVNTTFRKMNLPDWKGLTAKFDVKILALGGGCEVPLPVLVDNTQDDEHEHRHHDCRSGRVGCDPVSARYIHLEGRVVPAELFTLQESVRSKGDSRGWEQVRLHIDDKHPVDYEHYSVFGDFLGDTNDAVEGYGSYASRGSPREFLRRIQAGELECVLVGEQFESSVHIGILLLVLAWVGDGVAKRFDLVRFIFEWDGAVHEGEVYADALFSRVKGLKTKRFWLV
ncbi:heterokaryon incompatibility protein-domain-containing protein [Podospora australis]|uniref:Heterokaryon incompatibility protein-domain-containing protein n=1 Tax=Podospora australis TaxID=1536484 RepID=A0AAN6WM14_9PEZI|nr:heterokaryon incompatibility protein-domain-containing protein [Podospora australis]